MADNGTPIIVLTTNAKGRANYPHGRLAPSNSRVLHISGTGSRRPDGTFAGAIKKPDRTMSLNIEEQTNAVLKNIEAVIKTATNGNGGLQNVIDAMVFLTDIKSHYAGMNAVWNEAWPSPEVGPTRTTIGFKELPSPELIVEVKCTAVVDIVE